MIQTYPNHIARNYIYKIYTYEPHYPSLLKKIDFEYHRIFKFFPHKIHQKTRRLLSTAFGGVEVETPTRALGLASRSSCDWIEMKPRSLEQPAIQVSVKVIVYNFIFIISTLFVISIMVHEFDSILIYIIYLNYVSTSATLWVPNSWSKAAPSAEVLCLCRLCPSPWAWHLGKLPDEIGVQNGPNETHSLRIHMVPLLNFEELHRIYGNLLDHLLISFELCL